MYLRKESMYDKYKARKITHKEYLDYLRLPKEPKEESMFGKYKSGKITSITYHNWWAQQKGFKNNEEYRNYKAQEKGYENQTDYLRIFQKQYYVNNRLSILERTRNYQQTHISSKKQGSSDQKEYKKHYRKTSNGKSAQKKSQDKHKRELGYNVINIEDISNSDYVGHHLDKINVLYIPETIHRSIWHSVLKNINMDKINKLAIEWYENTHFNKIDIVDFFK